MLITFNNKGIYCAQADVYIDPWQPVPKAIITHAHADHARPGNKHYLCHQHSAALLKLRLGDHINIQTLDYGQNIHINGVQVSLHPAGHIMGSAQIKLTYKGETWVISGDYKLANDGISTPFEPISCQHFVTESTFGLPIYRFPSTETVATNILAWIESNRKQNKNTLLVGYALGKAQRLIETAAYSGLPIFAHGAIANVQQTLIQAGHPLHAVTPTATMDPKAKQAPYVVVLPPSVLKSTWLKRFAPYEIAYCSGWMQLRGARRRKNVNRGFVLSDHADWDQLQTAIQATGAENIYVTHGYKTAFARWLQEYAGLEAIEIATPYEDDLLLEEEKDEAI